MSNDKITYESAVRSFDHTTLAGLEGYHGLREALNEIAKTAEGVTLAELLEAVRDIALTTPYADSCECVTENVTYPPTWPHKVERNDDWLTCSYRCPHCGREWTCGYSVNVMHWL